MRFDPESSHQANAGLKVARDLLEQVKRKFLHIAYWACSLFYGLSPRLSRLVLGFIRPWTLKGMAGSFHLL